MVVPAILDLARDTAAFRNVSVVTSRLRCPSRACRCCATASHRLLGALRLRERGTRLLQRREIDHVTDVSATTGRVERARCRWRELGQSVSDPSCTEAHATRERRTLLGRASYVALGLLALQ